MAVAEAEKPESKTPVDGKPDDISDLKAEADEILASVESEDSGATKEPKDSEKKEEQGESEGESEGEDSQPEGDDQETGSQPKAIPKGNRGFKRRQARLVSQRKEAEKKAENASSALEVERERRKLLELRLEQLETGKSVPQQEPNPEDYSGGVYDTGYLKAKSDFDEQKIDKKVSEKFTRLVQENESVVSKTAKTQQIEKMQKKHWDEADKMGNRDYDSKEEKAIEVMGAPMVNHIIENFPGDSHKIVYYLGTKEEEAEDLAELLNDESTMVRGVAEVGRILEKLKGPKTNLQPAPDPDSDLQGGAPSNLEYMQEKLDKMRTLLSQGKLKDGMDKILKFKKKAKERGITLS